ncbi:uncharacterized protein LOC128668441 [Microplitis demolitor]|uniref:uncharacterized protein LOC128668441 n=1 Tax=Microplitis demolitor TaxID=69319 RepID=UPI00235B7050|nr:uncharacterized protein LOC128668441 [Microplitis demolitor]
MVGPKLQDDLFVILTRFRSHIHALTADIEKMYRQIRVHPVDTKYQKIIYRNGPQASINTYTLDTVTYGTASASHLAVRSLHQLAKDEGHLYPLAATVLMRDFYVDDVLTGANSLTEAALLRDQLNELLKKGGFNLRKWASSSPALISNYPEHPTSTHMSLNLEATVKTLGIHWNSREDTLFYSVNLSKFKSFTKRTILSQIAKLFDPLGFLGPVIVYAKIIIQLCWKSGVSWDESIPQNIHEMWVAYQEQLSLLEKLRFPRCLICPGVLNIQIHGFCDASEKAYGACLYLRSTTCEGAVQVQLICSKSRVAPASTVSLPRLELCGAVLLANLYTTVRESLLLAIDDVYLWSDSTIALHWLKTPPHRLKTFVANRVVEVQRMTPHCHWRHLSSQDNPADFISQGQLPSEFIKNTLWPRGPAWLTFNSDFWPQRVLQTIDIPEIKPNIEELIACLALNFKGINVLERYSSFGKLQRVIAYVLRFIHNIKNTAQRRAGALTPLENSGSHSLIMRLTQYSAFLKEI